MTPEVAAELLKMVGKWADEGKEDLAHHGLELIAGNGEGEAEPPCPLCGAVAAMVEDTGTFQAPRKTCKQCGKSWNPKEASRG